MSVCSPSGTIYSAKVNLTPGGVAPLARERRISSRMSAAALSRGTACIDCVPSTRPQPHVPPLPPPAISRVYIHTYKHSLYVRTLGRCNAPATGFENRRSLERVIGAAEWMPNKTSARPAGRFARTSGEEEWPFACCFAK